jgi:LemA protein
MATGLLVVLVVAVGITVLIYNGLVRLRNQTQNAWRQIDVQLNRRRDLVPNLVEAVKGAMAFERDTLERVVAARARATTATGVAARADAENALSASLARLFAVIENYPTLKANENVLQLQEELTTTENQVAFARQHYNDMVLQFNTRQQVFPGNMVAGAFGFAPAELFAASDSARTVPAVDLSLPR